MTYLNMTKFAGRKHREPTEARAAQQTHESNAPTDQAFENLSSLAMSKRHRIATETPSEAELIAKERETAYQVEAMVKAGRQKDLDVYFRDWAIVPPRVGDWELRVNIREQDGVPVSRTVIALPLTVRTRLIFEDGCIATLVLAGYHEEDAKAYFKAAWKKKYVWVETVYAATKEMIDAFQNTSVPQSYKDTGDPRRLAATVAVPKNPYQTSHAHFLVAIDMAIAVINARVKREELAAVKVEKLEEPQAGMSFAPPEQPAPEVQKEYVPVQVTPPVMVLV